MRTRRLGIARMPVLGLLVALCLTVVLPIGAASAATFNTWTRQTSGTTQALYGVAFVAKSGWAVGGGGTIRHTTNGGTTWTAQTSGTTQALYGVAFADASNGWAVGAGGTIRHTTNGGGTWTAQTSGTTQTLNGVTFTDASNGWAVGGGGTIRHTTNGGGTWTAQTSGTTQTLNGVTFTDASNGWAVGGRGTIRHTTNGGTTWSSQSSGVKNKILYGIAFVDATRGSLVGANGILRHTTNGGSSWTAQTPGTTQALYGVAFADLNVGWAVGAGGTIRHTANGGSAWTTETSGTTQTLRSLARSTGGLWAAGAGGTILTYLPDATPPTTTATGLQPDDHTGWLKKSRSVTLTASDGAGSGVAAVYYTLDGGGQQTYAGAFTVSGTGQHQVTYWALDKAGNVEATHTGWVNIDLLAPTVGDDTDALWHNGEVTVHLSPADLGGSGLAATQYRPQGASAWSAAAGDAFTVAAPADGSNDGTHLYEYRALDGAGNASVTGACTVHIDTTPATCVATGLAADQLTGWTASDREVTLTADDGAGSGVAAVYYTLDGGGQQTYAGAFTVSGTGQHQVTYWALDKAGNVEATHTGWVNIDLLAPTVGDDTDALWHNGEVTVHLSPADLGGSGLAATQYRPQGASAWSAAAGDAFTVAAPADGSNDGTHLYEYRALDGAGNASVTGACTVHIDTTPATCVATGLAADQLTGWTASDREVTLTADDGAGSGVAAVYYTLDGGGQQTYAGAFTVSGTGQHQVTYWALDKAGNVEATHTGWVNIADLYAEPTGLSPDAHSGWRNTDAAVTITAGGGPAPLTVSYKLDGNDWQTIADSASFTVSGVGNHTIVYHATNALSETSTEMTGYVNIETTAPVTTRSTVPAGWRHTALTVTLTPADADSGVAATFYSIDAQPEAQGTSVTIPAPLDHTMDGVHTVRYHSVDKAGNVETTRSFVVRIDTRRPTTRAPYRASVIRLATAKLRCKVVDRRPSAVYASAQIVVKKLNGRVVFRKSYARVRTNVLVTLKFRCRLARGTYRFFVLAKDAAGNRQLRVGYNRLTVR